MRPVRGVKRVLLAIGAVLGGAVYVWFAGVRAVPEVKRRKAARRAARERRNTG
jgi:hypothetical protein